MKNSILAISEKKETLRQIRKELAEKYEVLTINNLLNALDMLRESDFDIILLDEEIHPYSLADMKKKLASIGKDFVTIALFEDFNEDKTKEMTKAGIHSYLTKPVSLSDIDKVILSSLHNLELMKENHKLSQRLADLEEGIGIVGESAKIKEVKALIDRVADSDLPVLITGEKGVGKLHIAREIYKKSDRKKQEYVQISCATIPAENLEKELFGYERGSFIGANTSKKGILEEIDGGTIYIEDIELMDTKVQGKLVKVIESGELRRVGGGSRVRRVDVRFIIGSDIDLKEATEQGLFKKDLYHRLTTFPIVVPPLRERKEDVPLLVNYFLNRVVKELHRETPVLSGEAMKYLMEYSYPRNVRELKNMVERMVLMADEKIIDVEDLPLEIKMKSATLENKTVVGVGPLKDILEQEIYSLDGVEKVVIASALQKTRWNKQETSKLLGIGRTTLYEKIRKYGLDIK